MELAGVIVAAAAALFAGASAWYAARQFRLARDEAEKSDASATLAQAAADRVAAAQEKLAAIAESERDAEASRQAKMVRIEFGRHDERRWHVEVTNASDAPIFDVRLESVTALVDDDERLLGWRPNPSMGGGPVGSAAQIDGPGSRKLYFLFDEAVPDRTPMSPVVRFSDSSRRPWLITSSNEVVPADDE